VWKHGDEYEGDWVMGMKQG
jgi:hypothetical protein